MNKPKFSDFNFSGVSTFNKYEIDLERGLLKTDGTPEDHDRAMSALEIMAQMRTSSKPSPTPQPSEENAVEGALVAVKDKGITLKDLVEQFFKLRSQLTQATSIAYRNTVDELEKYTKIKYVNLLKVSDINRFQNYLADKGNSPRTIDNKMANLKAIFNFGVDRQYIKSNPIVGKPLMTKKQKIKEQWAIFEEDEIRLIYDSKYFFEQKEKDEDYYFILLFAIFTGCRVDELTTLKKEDFKTTSTGINYFHIRDSKTVAGIREIPIYEPLWHYFKPFLDKKTDKIFKYIERDGKGSGNAVGKKFSRHMGIVKIKRRKLVFHSLRKFYNNTLGINDVPEKAMYQLLGHEVSTNDVNSEFYRNKLTIDKLYELTKKPCEHIANLIGNHITITSKNGEIRRIHF